VAGVLTAEGKALSKSCQSFLPLLEELDFQPGAMMEEKGQPIEGRVGSVKQETVGRREGNFWSRVTGGKGDQMTGGKA